MNMKKFIGCIILITLCQLTHAENGNNTAFIDQKHNHIVDFDGREYKLAWESNRNSTVAKEFVTGNETLSNWTRLISIRKFTALSINQAIPLYIKKVGSQLAENPTFVKNDRIMGNHVFIEMNLKPQDDYEEFILVLFIEKKDGVYMYQFSRKIDLHLLNDDVVLEAQTEIETLIETQTETEIETQTDITTYFEPELDTDEELEIEEDSLPDSEVIMDAIIQLL